MRTRSLLLVAVVAVSFWAVLSVRVQSQGGGGQVQLPEGPGKALVQASCTACHGLNNITNS